MKFTTQIMIRKSVVYFFLFFLLINFCYSQNNKDISANKNSPIEYIRWIRQIPSVEKEKRTLKIWLYELFFGEIPPIINKPVSIACIDSDNIWILDHGNNDIVDIFEKKKKVTKYTNKDFSSLVGICITTDKEILFTDSRVCKIFKIKSGLKKPVVLNDSLKLSQPTGIAFSKINQEIWVVETGLHRISILNTKGELIRTIGKRGTGSGEFNFPTSIWIDDNGLVYIVDAMNFRVQIFDKTGEFISAFGKAGDATGFFARSKGIATDSFGNIYISDALFNSVQIFNKNGKFLYNFGKYGNGQEQFSMPAGIFIDKDNFIYIADSFNARIQVFQLINGNQLNEKIH